MADAFLQAFEEIDEDCSGEITVPELRKYMKKKNYEEAFVEVSHVVADVLLSTLISASLTSRKHALNSRRDRTDAAIFLVAL